MSPSNYSSAIIYLLLILRCFNISFASLKVFFFLLQFSRPEPGLVWRSLVNKVSSCRRTRFAIIAPVAAGLFDVWAIYTSGLSLKQRRRYGRLRFCLLAQTLQVFRLFRLSLVSFYFLFLVFFFFLSWDRNDAIFEIQSNVSFSFSSAIPLPKPVLHLFRRS